MSHKRIGNILNVDLQHVEFDEYKVINGHLDRQHIEYMIDNGTVEDRAISSGSLLYLIVPDDNGHEDYVTVDFKDNLVFITT